MFHSTLAVQPGEAPAIPGLAHQLVRARQEALHKGRETRQERCRRKGREFDHWYDAPTAIGPPQGGCQVSAADRAGGMFGCQRQAMRQGAEGVRPPAEAMLRLRTRPHRAARTVALSAAWGRAHVLPPRNGPTAAGKQPVEAWVIRAWETTAPPTGEEPLGWGLLSTLPVEAAERARERLQGYRRRRLVEHCRKALRTGCRMEEPQLRQGEARERQPGFPAIVAVRLLQVETRTRCTPDLPAGQAADSQLPECVRRLRRLDAAPMTIHQFRREVARFGGFLGRKSDGGTGRQTLWRGWNDLYPRSEGCLPGGRCG